MPQASPELRERIFMRFGDSIDDHGPWEFLRQRGYTAPLWVIRPPEEHKVTADERECIDFLCDEWDWAFEPR